MRAIRSFLLLMTARNAEIRWWMIAWNGQRMKPVTLFTMFSIESSKNQKPDRKTRIRSRSRACVRTHLCILNYEFCGYEMIDR
jgi:hypothetical protein